jgi:hypothetical protein
MIARPLAGLACSVLLGCAEAPMTVGEPGETRRLGTQATALPLPKAAGDTILLDVVRVDNPDQQAVTLRIAFDGAEAPPRIVALYPPDRPARIAVPLPPGAKAVRVKFVEGSEAKAPRVEVRLMSLAKPR